ASVMLGVSALHWGGEYDWLGVPLMFGGIFLWVVVFIIALRSYFVGEKVGDWLDALVILFLAYSIFSFQRSEAGFPARLEFMWTWVYGGLFFAMRYGVHNRDWMIGMTLFFVFIASLVCLYALINKDNPTHEIWGLERPNYGVRISGTFGCPNHFANFLSLATASAFYLGTVEKFPWPLRILLFYLSGLFTVGIFFSVSRGGYLAWLFAMAPITGYVLRTIRIKWWWKVFVSTIFVSGILLTIFRNDFVLGRLERTLSGDIRLQLIVDAVKIWNQDRWFGTGTASFDFYHLRFPDFHAGRAVHTHNDYLNTLSDYGAVGLGLVLLFLLGYLLQLIIRSKYLKSERETTLWRIGFSALAAMAIHETVDFNLHIPACAILFFALVGMSVSRTFRQRKCRKYYLSFAPVILLAGLAMFIWVTPLIWQTWCGQQLSRYSQEELLSMDSSEVIFKADQAYTADPGASKTQVHYANALRVKASQKVTELKQTGTRRLSDYREAENLAKKAIQIYTRVHESNPLEDTLIVNIAMTYDAIDDFQSASLYYKKALDLRPHSGTFHYALGFHYLNQNNLKNALFSFKKAMNQGNKLPDIQRQVDEADRMIRLINKQLKETPRH
ncbi:MAG: O-antigen ligase family protein, partial [Verrucomicrobiota bacterium]